MRSIESGCGQLMALVVKETEARSPCLVCQAGGFDWQLPKLCRMGLKKTVNTLFLFTCTDQHCSQPEIHHIFHISYLEDCSCSWLHLFTWNRYVQGYKDNIPPSIQHIYTIFPNFSHAVNIHCTFTKKQCIAADVQYFNNKLIWCILHARWIFPSTFHLYHRKAVINESEWSF